MLQADLSVADNDGNTPLHAACAIQAVAIIELLATRGADRDAINHKKYSCAQLFSASSEQQVRLKAFMKTASNQLASPRTRGLRKKMKKTTGSPQKGPSSLAVQMGSNQLSHPHVGQSPPSSSGQGPNIYAESTEKEYIFLKACQDGNLAGIQNQLQRLGHSLYKHISYIFLSLSELKLLFSVRFVPSEYL